MPLNTEEGGYTYNGNSYLARIISENFSTTQARSEGGIDRIPAVTLKLADPDYFLWLSYEMNQSKGFCGAIMTCSVILMDISPTTGAYVFTSDSPGQFIGICDPPGRDNDGATMTLSAQSSHNMGKVYQPYVQVQQRCPWVFPVGPAQRLTGGTDPSSNFWFCGYDPDQAGTDPELGGSCERGNTTTANLVIGGVTVTDANGIYIACDYTAKGAYGCTAHGMYSTDSNGRQTGRFGGEQWAPTTLESRSKSYTTSKEVTVFSAANTAIYLDRFPMVYGTQWVIPPIVINELGDANSTRGEACICMGNIGTYGILQVVLNSVIVPRNNAGNPLGPGATPTDPLQRWNFTGGGTLGYAYGSRNGAATVDAGFDDSNGNPQGDPHGSHACIEWVVYSELLQSTTLPSMMILASGPQVWVWDNPTTKVLQFSNSPVWAVMDVLIHSNWSFAEFDIQTFITAAQVAFVSVSYVSLTGATLTHSRYLCEMVIHQRRTAQEIVQMMLRCFNAQLIPNSSTGLLQMLVRQTLADQQSSPMLGSNYNTPIQSLPGNASQTLINTYEAEGTTGSSGYVAWMFDESSIYRPATADGQGAPRIRVYTTPNLQRPNEVTFPFQDRDNSYVQDSLTLDDGEAINRAGGYNGAVLNTETYQVLGISNFDQAIRIANVYLAEQNHGNPEGDARGTYYFEFETTVRVECLRVGNICLVQNQSLGMNGATPLQSPAGTPIPGFLTRVISVAPTTDFERVTVTLAWHEDIWYTDLFGQAPAPFYSAQARGIPARPPYAWSPYGQQPIAGDAMWPSTFWGFAQSQSYSLNADGTAICRVAISGCPPANKFATVLPPPLAAIQGTTSATGGSIAGNQTLYLMLSGFDVSNLPTPVSLPCVVQIPAGTNTNTASITGIFFPAGTVSWTLYAGIDQQRFCEQSSGTGTPSSIQLNSLNLSTYGAPDALAQSIYFRWKREIHGGIWGAQANAVDGVGPGTLTFTGGNFGTTGWNGRIVTKLANAAGNTANIPIADYLVTSSSGNVLTVTPDPAAAGIQIGDVFEMRTQPTTFSSTTIGDSGFVNGFSTGLTPGAEVGNRVRVIGGYGVMALNQERTIVSNTSTVLTVDTPFDVTPNATSIFLVLEGAWQGTYDVPYTSATPAPSPPPLIATLDVTNFKSQTIFIEALIEDGAGTTAMEYFSPYRELYVWGSAGTPGGATIAPLTLSYSGNLGNVGTPFSGACAVTGGVPGTVGYTYAVTSGSLPPGLSLNTGLVPATKANAGQVTGTPTTVEYALPYVIVVTDSVDNQATTTGTITILPTGASPFADVVTGLTLTVSFRANGNQGGYQFQVAGKFTPPVDTAYAYSIAVLFVVGASGTPGTAANPGAPLAANVAPAVNSWNGPWYDVPSSSTEYMVYVWCININGLQSTLNTNTSASPITISAAIAQAYVNGGTTVVGAEIPNATLSSVAIVYNYGQTADGAEGYNVVGTAAAPNDPRFANAQMILCPIADVSGYNGTVGATIPAISTAAPTAFNILVCPWGVNTLGTCTVATDGVTITNITAPIAAGLAGNFVSIGVTVYQVLTYVSSSSVILYPGSGAAAGSNVEFISLECRYTFTAGDTVQIGNERFTLSAYSQTCALYSGGPYPIFSTWTLTTMVGQTASTHATGLGQMIVDVLSPAGNVDDYAGTLLAGTTQSVSDDYGIGLPTAYIAYLVSLSTDGLYNTWPVVGETPSYIIGAVEAQTTGNLQPGRLTPTQLDATMAVVNGKLRSLVPTGSNMVVNGSFSSGALGQPPPGWSNGGAAFPAPGYVQNFTGVPNGDWYITNGTASVTGGQSLEITANGGIASAGQACAPTQQYGMQCSLGAVGANSTSTAAFAVSFYDSDGAYISGSPVTTITAASTLNIWTRYPLAANALITATAPANAAYVYFGLVIAGLTGGAWALDNVTIQTLTPGAGVQTAGPVGVDSLGNLNILPASILQQHISNLAIGQAQIQVAAVAATNLASGAAASNVNLVANSLNANTINAPNAVITQLIAGSVTATLSLLSTSLIITGSNFYMNVDNANGMLMTCNSGAYAGTIIHINPVSMSIILNLPSGLSLGYTATLTPAALSLAASNSGYTAEMTSYGYQVAITGGAVLLNILATGVLMMTNLPTSSPGSGTKQFYYLPGSGNAVYFAP